MKNDIEYEDDFVVKVDVNADSGWSVKMGSGWSIWVESGQCSTAPKEGETIRLYGKGIGYTVRGVVIGNRVYRYTSAEQSEVEQAEMCARLKREREESEAKFRANLSNLPKLPEFTITDRETWDKAVSVNDDPYGYACIKYAAGWANLMESRLASGGKVADIAKQASHDADTDGITGFMYGCAVSILSKCWAHGEELRRWHNGDVAIGGEGERANASGGVLNPALLSVGG